MLFEIFVLLMIHLVHVLDEVWTQSASGSLFPLNCIGASITSSGIVMPFAANNNKNIIFQVIGQPICVVDTTAPKAGQIVLQGFRFFKAGIGVSPCISNKGIYAF